MRGKTTNLFMALVNILLGVLLIVFSIKVPQDITEFTVQENQIVSVLRIVLYVIIGIVTFFNVIYYFVNNQNSTRKTGYLVAFFAISYILVKHYIIGILPIVAGFIIIAGNFKEKWIEINSIGFISLISIIMLAMIVVGGICFLYKNIGEYIIKKQNENELAYNTEYFRYVTELGIEDIYINVKKDGKYGYINTKGETVIDFKYDYASPFVKISSYDKNFEIALVCLDGRTLIILKNERLVMSYRSESSDENYKAKLQELQNIYTNTLGQPGTMECEIKEIKDHINRAPVYEEISSNYTFRYDYNDEYDLIVTQSNLGLGDKYELAKKEDLNIRVVLDTTDLDYDSKYLYLFSNGDIPFYEVSKLYQGWFTSYGKKNEMRGRAQILDFFGDRILIRNYNNKTVYFSNTAGDILSEVYKDIFISNNNRYIVKNENDSKMKVIDGNYKKAFETEYDIINPRLASENLYLCMNIDKEIEFNDYGFAKMIFSLVNYYGEVLFENIEQIYSEYFELSEGKGKEKEKYNDFINKLKDLDYNFVGDKFYTNYNN